MLGDLHRVVLVERMVPDELWELFQRVVPPAPSRPQGGGRLRSASIALFDLATLHLVENKVLLPGATVLERMV